MPVIQTTLKKSLNVGAVEDLFKESMGIGIQIMTPNGKYFAPNDMPLKNVGMEPSK